MTALRWQEFLGSLSLSADVTVSWSGRETDLLIALHANRSHDSIVRFKKKYYDRPIVLVLTGTDLYRDMATHEEVLHSMELADAIVLLQSSALEVIPPRLQNKAQVIYQSVQVSSSKTFAAPDFRVTVIGHLREEKDPFCIARSLFLMPPDSQIHVLHLGKAMDTQMELMAKSYNKKLDRYRWIGEVSHDDALNVLSQSHLMVISSRMEGGAHVVSEAIALGVPVIASDIPGNRGLLGADYPGYYPVADESALATLLYKAETNPELFSSLKKHIDVRSNLVTAERERQSIRELLDNLMRK